MTPAEAIPKTIKVFQKTRYQKLRTETEAQIRASFSHSIHRDNTARRKRPAFAGISSPSLKSCKNKDLLAGAAGFKPLHIRIGICPDSQPGGQDSNLRISNRAALLTNLRPCSLHIKIRPVGGAG